MGPHCDVPGGRARAVFATAPARARRRARELCRPEALRRSAERLRFSPNFAGLSRIRMARSEALGDSVCRLRPLAGSPRQVR